MNGDVIEIQSRACEEKNHMIKRNVLGVYFYAWVSGRTGYLQWKRAEEISSPTQYIVTNKLI